MCLRYMEVEVLGSRNCVWINYVMSQVAIEPVLSFGQLDELDKA